MNIPMIFKPIYVDYIMDKLKSKKYQEKYKGLWVDGGMLNNFPIHAFDDLEQIDFIFRGKGYLYNIAKTKANTTSSFCDCVVGFRLKGVPATDKPLDENEGVLFTYLGALMNTFMFSGGDGQIRSIAEEENTIYLDAFSNVDEIFHKEEVELKEKFIEDNGEYISVNVTDFASANLDSERGGDRMYYARLKKLLIEKSQATVYDKIK